MTLPDLSHLARPLDDADPLKTWDSYRSIIDTHIDNQPRSLQARIGPSEFVSCDACLISKLAGIPERRDPGTSWLPFVGTSVHEQLQNIFAAQNTGPQARFLTELTVSVGEVAGVDITGHVDLYDLYTGDVTDWKAVGVTTLRKVRKNGPSTVYRTQGHLYGRGLIRRGLPVNRVRIAYLPRNSRSLADAEIWDEPYDEQVALDALARADRFATWIGLFGADALLSTAAHTGTEFSCSRYLDPGLFEPVAHDALAL